MAKKKNPELPKEVYGRHLDGGVFLNLRENPYALLSIGDGDRAEVGVYQLVGVKKFSVLVKEIK